jgi:hypothetical protein
MKPLTFLFLGATLYLGSCSGPIEQWKRWHYPDYGLKRGPHWEGEEDANATQPPTPRH